MADSKQPQKTVKTRRELESQIVANAWRDAAYRKRLLADPKDVLQDELRKVDANASIPDDLDVSIHEEDVNHMHIVLPRNPQEFAPDAKLGDLEQLAPQTVAVVVNTVNNVVTAVVSLVTPSIVTQVTPAVVTQVTPAVVNVVANQVNNVQVIAVA